MSELDTIKNFYQLTPTIGTSGMPNREQIQQIADAGYEIVINLALPSFPQAVSDEGALFAARGVTYVHMPVDFDHPTPAHFERFAAILRAYDHTQVFVHCALNYRVSAFMYLYRLVEEQATPDQAKRDLNHLWEPVPAWQDLIDEVLDTYHIDIDAHE